MHFDSNVIKPSPVAPRWQDVIKKYQTPETWRSVWQIANSILPYLALWYLMYWSLSVSYLLTLALAIPAGGLVMRIFILQHDCGHGSFFKSQKANDRFGTICGFLTMIPYYQWRHEHAIHHASSGDLSRRGTGDVTTLTVKEYQALSPLKRLRYRAYRSMPVLLLIGPFYTFVASHRFVRWYSGKREARNVYLTNLALFSIWGTLCLTMGVKSFLMIWLPVTLFSGIAGIWLFYVQHQYEDTYWKDKHEWDYVTAAVMGSSYYHLPRIIQWFSGNIGFHHIHHLSPKIPNYKLEQCHKETPMFQEAVTLTFWKSLKTASLRLWDEDQQKMIGFKALKKQ